MGRRLAACAVILLLAVSASAVRAHDEEYQAELLDEVLRLTEAGVPDHLVIEQIEAWQFEFELTADDIIELRTLGVSDAVIEALVGTAGAEYERRPVRYVGLSTGFYSPWYWFPYAWGYYYDPFPWAYSFYYYPFGYHVPHFGHYGWVGCSYYYAYHRRDRPVRWGPAGRGTVYVASHVPSRRVTQVVAPGAGRPRVVRSTPTWRRSAAGALVESKRAVRLRTYREPFRARTVARPQVPARGQGGRDPGLPAKDLRAGRGFEGARRARAEARSLPIAEQLQAVRRGAPSGRATRARREASAPVGDARRLPQAQLPAREAGRAFVPVKELRIAPSHAGRSQSFARRDLTGVQMRGFTGWRGSSAPRMAPSPPSRPAVRVRGK